MKHSTGALLAATAALSLSACTTADTDDADGPHVIAAFYPLEYVATSLMGDEGTVGSLAAASVEPHDLELSPAAVRSLQDADLVVYLSDFQPAVDDAIASTGASSFDVASVVALHESGHDHDEEAHEDDHDHEDEAHEDEAHDDEHDHGVYDPHFWQDPELLGDAAQGLAAQLIALDPALTDEVNANLEALLAELDDVDAEYAAGLASCERTEIVVTHEAFGYLTERYGLSQEGIAGIDPDTEPSPARLREVRDFIESTGTTTIFAESLVNPAVAESLANDAGAQMAVLSPLETPTEGQDYIETMRSNLEALRQALNCD